MPSSRFTYTWEEVMKCVSEYCLELEISVDWEPFRDAVTEGPSDNWAPAEGGGFEVTKATLEKLYVTEPRVGQIGISQADEKDWLARFAREVEGTEEFRDWVGDQVDQGEADAEAEADEARGDWDNRRSDDR